MDSVLTNYICRGKMVFSWLHAKADPSRLLDKLGSRYEVARTNIKKMAVGSPIQAHSMPSEILPTAAF